MPSYNSTVQEFCAVQYMGVSTIRECREELRGEGSAGREGDENTSKENLPSTGDGERGY